MQIYVPFTKQKQYDRHYRYGAIVNIDACTPSANCGEQSDMLVSLISTGFGKGGVEQLIFYTNLMDGGLQAWYERMPKEGVF